MKAKLKPLDSNKYSTKIIESCFKNKVFNFEYAFTLNGIEYYEPIDINFPSSNPVPLHDLEVVE